VRIVNKADWRLATTPPTTLAGVAAVLQFANEIEDGGMEWPSTRPSARGLALPARATMAQAIEAIILKPCGGLACNVITFAKRPPDAASRS
jgi:hypothetical protein